ncbi:hypothetical protein [Streptomyces sp. NPDC094468]|uniref:hypothetical protein n=1 Tax=Streptomyces sp. NPDC094468 TaxID=3366066 RepID=UPI00380FC234
MRTATGALLDPPIRDLVAVRLRELVGHAVTEVRITRVRWDESKRWVVMLLDERLPGSRRELPVDRGGLHHLVAILIRDAFPHADWSRAQDYDVVHGALREHVVRVPAALAGDAL